MKARVKGWTYGHSDSNNQDIAFRKDGNGNLELYTEDKTYYNWHEISLIAKHKDGLPLQVHLIKKAFMGEIIL